MQIQIDTHTHTISSGHAYSTLSENVKRASEIGLKGICITDHGPVMTGAPSVFHFNNLVCLPKTDCGVRIFTGVEANILDADGNTDIPAYTYNRLDIRMASLHYTFNDVETVEDATKAYINAMKNNNINVLGHPCDVRYPINIEEVVLAAKKYNVALEINNKSLEPNSYRYDKSESVLKLLELCKKHKVYITVGSDCHYINDVGEVTNSLNALEKVDFPEELVVNVNLERFEEFVLKHRTIK